MSQQDLTDVKAAQAAWLAALDEYAADVKQKAAVGPLGWAQLADVEKRRRRVEELERAYGDALTAAGFERPAGRP